MLTDLEANDLLNALKEMVSNKTIEFPDSGGYLSLDVNSVNSRDKFVIDVNRKGKINIKKATYQTRYQKTIQLLRLDIAGQPHTNPDGEEITCPHLHIYKEGYGDSWAFPIDENIFSNTEDLVQSLIEFLSYNKISNIPFIHVGGLV
jgi:hypothetical protein